jgi:hypothetical protein
MEQAVGGLLMGESAEVAFEMGSPLGEIGIQRKPRNEVDVYDG